MSDGCQCLSRDQCFRWFRHFQATGPHSDRPGTIGTSSPRPDGIAKVQGRFEFSSDLSADGCLWGATLRSPHPYARIVSIDVSGAWQIDGVETVITADDVPGEMSYGLIAQDQPVFASEVARYGGEEFLIVLPDTRLEAAQPIDLVPKAGFPHGPSGF